MKKKINSIFKLIKKSRKFQIEINNLINQKKIQIPVHLGIGHEFVASLVRYFFKKNDQILLTHRNIHYTSIFSKNAKKKAPPPMRAEKLLKITLQTASELVFTQLLRGSLFPWHFQLHLLRSFRGDTHQLQRPLVLRLPQ